MSDDGRNQVVAYFSETTMGQLCHIPSRVATLQVTLPERYRVQGERVRNKVFDCIEDVIRARIFDLDLEFAGNEVLIHCDSLRIGARKLQKIREEIASRVVATGT
jgi:hypothetical protein